MKKFFRPISELFDDSMKQAVEVQSLEDVVNHFKDFYGINEMPFHDIHIGESLRDCRTENYPDWGPETYRVLCNLGTITNLYIGYVNFYEPTLIP